MSIFVENISKLYGKQKALNEVSFSVKPGEIVGFLGPNGAGKSTMMKIITGFIPPNSGTVKVCDIDVQESPIAIKRKIGYLPEQNPLYDDMYVREYLHFICGIFKIKDWRKKTDEIIQQVGLEVEQNKKIKQLSKGFKQRVGLAQALLHDPEVLILDEPTTGLDVNQLEEIRNLIIKIGAEKTVMLSTHIMQEVEAICNRVIIINNGIIVANEKVSEMGNLFNKNDFFLVRFSAAINIEKIKKIDGIITVKKLKENNYRIESRKEKGVQNDLFQLANAAGLSILNLQKEESKLEDIFKQLTKGVTVA